MSHLLSLLLSLARMLGGPGTAPVGETGPGRTAGARRREITDLTAPGRSFLSAAVIDLQQLTADRFSKLGVKTSSHKQR